MLKFIDFETGSKIIRYISESPVFKGSALIILSLIAFIATAVMVKNGRKRDINFWVFAAAAAIILLYGAYILIAQPQWWKPPV
ncbi:MAG: hypothetical protein NTZ10_00780 [Candidatus Saganbacteria bacterium]|nr:hypothetical protein [Candidatus Saganbacteria bacterium]